MRIEIMKKIPHRLIFLFFNIYRLKRKKRRELKNDSNNNIGFLPGHWLTYLNSKNTVKFVYSKKIINYEDNIYKGGCQEEFMSTRFTLSTL